MLTEPVAALAKPAQCCLWSVPTPSHYWKQKAAGTVALCLMPVWHAGQRRACTQQEEFAGTEADASKDGLGLLDSSWPYTQDRTPTQRGASAGVHRSGSETSARVKTSLPGSNWLHRKHKRELQPYTEMQA